MCQSQPIINHIQYLTEQNETQVGEHVCRENTKLLYFSCGCVVVAEQNPSKNPLAVFRHHTIPCPKHTILRANNFTFPEIEKITGDKIKNLLQ